MNPFRNCRLSIAAIAGAAFLFSLLDAHGCTDPGEYRLTTNAPVEGYQRAQLDGMQFGPAARLELQPDFFANIWAHYAARAKHVVEPGDIEEALRAAGVIGDDNLQRRSQGYVVPILHGRHLRATRTLVSQRLRDRRPQTGRHLRRP